MPANKKLTPIIFLGLKKLILPLLRENSIKEFKKKETEEKRKKKFYRLPLRLRGGGSPENVPVENYRLRAGAPTKSPIVECREIMDQFDKILEEYRKALSPCGQIACNYAPNVTEGLCKKSCGIKPEETNTQGCGLPECEYAKYKSALMAMDADIEKQFIGPAILGNCGHPKCSYQADKILPPIHWDCPEPLPEGKCRNPNCPYASQEVKTEGRFSTSKGPCGSDQCPYAPPAPCSSPNCPFKNPPPCADLKKSSPNKTVGGKGSVGVKEEVCAGCPFANPPQIVNMVFCDNPNCPIMTAVSEGDCGKRDRLCISPNCPYKSIQNQCSNPNCPYSQGDVKNECSNPNCPLGLKENSSGSCTNPNCPFANKPAVSTAKSCSNPNCPLASSSTEPSSESCANPDCGYKSSSISSGCSNPDCPFRTSSKDEKEPEKETCANPYCPFNVPSVESCKNPDCPFKNKDSTTESKESCDNPDCPYKKASKTSDESECVCDNPTCPGKKDTCINPNCPFNLRGYGPCTNPDCPHKKDALGRDLGFCATPDASFNEFCADKTCPYHDRKLDKPATVGPGGKLEKTEEQQTGEQETVEAGVVERTTGDRPSIYDMAPCSIKTCKFMGGHLTCVDCGIGTDGKKRGPCPKTCPGRY